MTQTLKLTTKDVNFINGISNPPSAVIYSRGEHDENSSWIAQAKAKVINGNVITTLEKVK